VGDRGTVNLHDWIDELCDALDVEIDLDAALVLDVARDAATNVDKAAAPITAFLLGYAAARSEADPEETERLASAASDLALRWDKEADVVETEDGVPEIDAGTDTEAGPEIDSEIDPEIDDDLEAAEA
jgi:hypothetical protein